MSATIIPFPQRRQAAPAAHPHPVGSMAWIMYEVYRIRNEKDRERGWPPRYDLDTLTRIDHRASQNAKGGAP